MKHLTEFGELNEAENMRSAIWKKEFAVSKPPSMDRANIFSEIKDNLETYVDGADKELTVDSDFLAAALKNDSICQKFVDKYFELFDDFEGDEGDRSEAALDFVVSFVQKTKELKKSIKTVK